MDWYQVINEKNDVAWKKFNEMFLSVIDSVAAVTSVRLKQGCEPWFYSDILKLIISPYKAWIKFIKCKNETSYAEYKRLRNRTQCPIKKTKRHFARNLIGDTLLGI